MEEPKAKRPYLMIATMFAIIASLRIVYSVIASFLPLHIKLTHNTITSSKTGFILA